MNREKDAELAGAFPPVFPSILDSSGDRQPPFWTVREYEAFIDKNPDDMSALIELSLVYSLLGDYQSSLKYLGKAMALDASDPYPIVLAAKNRLWKGDVNESLALYERALSVTPDDVVLWSEAGKVAAWTANYNKAIDFFTRGITLFPDDLNLMVNLGLTYLWMSRSGDAEETLAAARDIAAGEPSRLKELGRIEEVNGYPKRAREVYKLSIEQYPEYLEFYLLLQQSYLSSGLREEADAVGVLIEDSFKPSERLESELEIYMQKLSLRDDVIRSYLDRLDEEPGNLALRQELAQTFFWNGMRAEAIEQIKYVITTHSYRTAETFVRRNADLMGVADLASAYSAFFGGFGSASAGLRRRLQAAGAELSRAEAVAENSEDPAASAEQLRLARQEYADAVAAADYLAGLWDEMLNGYDALESGMKETLAAEKADSEAFAQVVRSSGWSWDRGFISGELGQIMETEPKLAAFMLGLIRLSEKDYTGAVSAVSAAAEKKAAAGVEGQAEETAGEEAEQEPKQQAGAAYDYSGLPAEVIYPLYQAMSLEGDGDAGMLIASDGERLSEAYPQVSKAEEIKELARALGGEGPSWAPPDGVYYDGLAEESAAAIETLTGFEREVRPLVQKINRLLNQQSAVYSARLSRANYYLEADTYLIRFELGNYYLDEGMNLDASVQFRRVVAVDPWNISAAYKLGVVEQRYGNWSEAMKYYRKVYYQDPSYENTVFYYNQLARENADNVDGLFQLTATPQEFAYEADFDYGTKFNSLFGFDFGYSFDQQRRYRAFAGEQTGYFQVHRIEAGLPLSFGLIGLELSPKAGVFAESLYYKADYSIPDEDKVSFPEFGSTWSVYPLYGLSARWRWEFLTIDADWEYSIEPDTFYPTDTRPEGLVVRMHDISLNANTWFDFDDPDFFGPVTTRTYGRLQLLADGNIKGQFYQDVLAGFTLLELPIIKLSPGLSFNYENSLDSPADGYYAPRNVIEAKGTLRSSFTFPSEDWSSVVEAILWGGCGGYWSNIGDSSFAAYLKGEGGLGFTLVKDGNVYYLNLSGLGTFDGGGNAYWEITAALGTGFRLPGLLAP